MALKGISVELQSKINDYMKYLFVGHKDSLDERKILNILDKLPL